MNTQSHGETQPESTYDVLVIGGDPAGENVADNAARSGLRVTLIEHELLGGECTFWACMPSKALLRPGEALEALRRVPGAQSAAAGEIDVDEALARRDSLASHWDDAGQVSWLDDAGVDLIRGLGRIAGERQVTVQRSDGSTDLFGARKAVVVATGSSAAMPPIDGLDSAGVWDSRDVTTAKQVPRRLLGHRRWCRRHRDGASLEVARRRGSHCGRADQPPSTPRGDLRGRGAGGCPVPNGDRRPHFRVHTFGNSRRAG